jgi:hypothetical protein
MLLSAVIKKIENEDSLKKGAKKTYINNINKFVLDLNEEDITKMLTNHKVMISYLLKRSSNINTRKTYFTTISTVFKYAMPDFDEKIVKIYVDEMRKYAKKSLINIKKNIPNKNIVFINDEGEEEIRPWSGIFDLNKQFTGDDFGNFDHAIIAMYTLIPPRRGEYYELRYLTYEPKLEDVSTLNVIYKKDDKLFMVLNNYKTDKKYGTYKTELPADLTKVLLKYIVDHKLKTKRILFPKIGSKDRYNDTSFCSLISKIFTHYYGNPLTINDIRHIFITTNVTRNPNITTEQKEAISYAMAHDICTQELYTKIAQGAHVSPEQSDESEDVTEMPSNYVPESEDITERPSGYVTPSVHQEEESTRKRKYTDDEKKDFFKRLFVEFLDVLMF